MDKFETSKNGYNKAAVEEKLLKLESALKDKDSKIMQLEKELSDFRNKEHELNKKGESISIALTAAVEKAKQIERSSQNVYKLKIEQLSILYARWEAFLNELLKKYPEIKEVENVKVLLSDFKKSLKSTIKDDFKINNITAPVQTDNDPIRLLLSKMNTYVGKKTDAIIKENKLERKTLNDDLSNNQTELSRLEEKAPLIRPIYDNKIEKGENYETLVDKFLTEEGQPNNVYASKLTSKISVMPSKSETGFDLKEAVNPKDDLNQIMKSFDFYTDNPDDNN